MAIPRSPAASIPLHLQVLTKHSYRSHGTGPGDMVGGAVISRRKLRSENRYWTENRHATATGPQCHVTCPGLIAGQCPARFSWRIPSQWRSKLSSPALCPVYPRASAGKGRPQPRGPERRHFSLCLLASALPRRSVDLTPLSRTFRSCWLLCSVHSRHHTASWAWHMESGTWKYSSQTSFAVAKDRTEVTH